MKIEHAKILAGTAWRPDGTAYVPALNELTEKTLREDQVKAAAQTKRGSRKAKRDAEMARINQQIKDTLGPRGDGKHRHVDGTPITKENMHTTMEQRTKLPGSMVPWDNDRESAKISAMSDKDLSQIERTNRAKATPNMAARHKLATAEIERRGKIAGWSDAAREASAEVRAAATRKKNQKQAPLADAAKAAGIRDPNAAFADVFGKPQGKTKAAAKPGSLADLRAQAKTAGISLAGAKTKAQVQDALARGKPGVISKAKYGGLAILGPAAIVGAGAVAFDATRNSAKASGKTDTQANVNATAAAAVASGTVAAIGYAMTKAVRAAAVVAPVAGKVLARAIPAVAIAGAVYEGGKGAVKGFREGGVTGAVKGAGEGLADFATMGAYSHFTGPKITEGQNGRLSKEQQKTFAEADDRYAAMQQAKKAEDSGSGWSDQARIAAYISRVANAGGTPENMPYGGKPRKAD